MQKYKKVIIGSFLALAIVLAPTASFADNENNNGRGNEQKNRIEIKNEFKSNAKLGIEKSQGGDDNENDSENHGPSFSQSLWNRIISFLTGRTYTNTDVTTTTPIPVNSSLSPNISGISAPTTLQVGETGTWKVNASDPQNGTLNYTVDWGDVVTQGVASSTSSTFVQTSTFTHAYSNAGRYTITFTVSNTAGLKAVSSTTVRVVNASDLAKPVISGMTLTLGFPTSTTILWRTNERTTSKIFYSTTTPVDVNSSSTSVVTDTSLAINHSLDISGLSPNTLYHFVVQSTDASGNTTTSGEFVFMTTAL